MITTAPLLKEHLKFNVTTHTILPDVYVQVQYILLSSYVLFVVVSSFSNNIGLLKITTARDEPILPAKFLEK